MSGPSPIRRLAAALGLSALLPISVMLVAGQLSLVEAGARGAVVLVAAVLLRRVVDMLVRSLVATVEVGRDEGKVGGEELEAAEQAVS